MNAIAFIKSDLYRYTGRISWFLFIREYALNNSFKYSVWLRASRSDCAFLRIVAKLFHRHLSNKLHLQIPVSTSIGYGLYIGHNMCIVINPTAKIGNNVNLSQFTTIGSNERRAATIGDSVYIGPGVSLVEDITIGSNVTIGAGSVVTKDAPDNATIAGCPARVLNYSNPGRYIQNKWNVQNNTK